MLPVNRKQPENKSELEEAYNALNQMFLKATQEVVPQKKSKKKKKPILQIMSDKILTAIKRKKEAFHLWKTNVSLKKQFRTTRELEYFFFVAQSANFFSKIPH